MLKIGSIITGTGSYLPKQVISNAELAVSFNHYAREYNKTHQDEITRHQLNPISETDERYIFQISGIKERRVIEKYGVLDSARMKPALTKRLPDEISYQGELALNALNIALDRSGKSAQEIDLVIVASSMFERAYPPISIELQSRLRMSGFAFDLPAGCASNIYAISLAESMIAAGSIRAAAVVCPEICSAYVNYRDRLSHFIFGDAASSLIIEKYDEKSPQKGFKIVNSNLKTSFSNNIRNDFGFLERTWRNSDDTSESLFAQQGHKVFKEVIQLVTAHVRSQLERVGLEHHHLKRLWLHQANIKMNQHIASNLIGENYDPIRSPLVIEECGNTSSAGMLLTFDRYHSDLAEGDIGLLCSFGAGYAIGSSVIVKV